MSLCSASSSDSGGLSTSNTSCSTAVAAEPLVIDFSDFLCGDSGRVEKCLGRIREACETQGFFQIIHHSVPAELQREILRQQKSLFDLPTEEKMKIDKSKNNYNRGYERIGSQRFQADDARPDLKEGYYCARDLPEDHPQVRAGKFAHGPNLWPEALGAPFKLACNEYLRELTSLTKQVLRAVIMSLDNDTSDLDAFLREPMCFFKMNHYPPPPDPTDKLQKSHGAHRDFGVITLLLQGDVPGLEVWDEPTHQWVLVPPMPGAYVVNLGNLFSQWTNDRYVSNLHRVTNVSGQHRHSIAFLFHGNPDYVVQCRDSCKEKGAGAKYPPISVEDYVRGQYQQVYSRAGVYKI